MFFFCFLVGFDYCWLDVFMTLVLFYKMQYKLCHFVLLFNIISLCYYFGTRPHHTAGFSPNCTCLLLCPDTRRYSLLCRLYSSSCGGLRLRLFVCPFGKKRAFFMLFLLNLGYFWWWVVTSVTFSCNLSPLENNPFV